MNVITALLFILSGLLGVSSLIPRQFYYISEAKIWTEAQSYCKLNYSNLVFVYDEEDVVKLKATSPPDFSGEGKRVMLRLKVNPGQLDLTDPGIRSDMLDQINEKFNETGFGDAINIRWITRQESVVKNKENKTCSAT